MGCTQNKSLYLVMGWKIRNWPILWKETDDNDKYSDKLIMMIIIIGGEGSFPRENFESSLLASLTKDEEG